MWLKWRSECSIQEGIDMKVWKWWPAFIVTFSLFVSGCAQEEEKSKEVDIKNPDGDSYGKITIEEQAKGVKFKLDLEGLSPGVHAIHVHDQGSCKPPDFTSAGEHFNPYDKEHGLLHPEGAHAGDLPNIIVKEDGKVKVDLEAPDLTLLSGKNSLNRSNGTSIVIHEDSDDGMSQPAGDAGRRIACGVIFKKEK